MPPTRLLRATLQGAEPPPACVRSARTLTARRRFDDDWGDDDPDQDAAERFDPDALDDDEPQPEPGDFWVEPDDNEV